MTTPDWHAEAKRLFAEGTPVADIARVFGRTYAAVAFALDFNNARQKHRDRIRKQQRDRKVGPKVGVAPLTDVPAWSEEARRHIEGGMSVVEAARAVGQSEYTVRYVLDINGRRAKVDAWRAAKRVRMAKRSEDRTSVRAYAEPAANRPLTLPSISLPALPFEAPVVRKFAPRTRLTGSPGAERWRQIHRAMMRAGKLPEPGLPEQLHH